MDDHEGELDAKELSKIPEEKTTGDLVTNNGASTVQKDVEANDVNKDIAPVEGTNNPIHVHFEHFQVVSPPKETYYHKTIVEETKKQHFEFSWRDFRRRNFYISGALDLEYFITTRGAENVHIYLWIAKDLSWTQDWEVTSMLFGVAALAWCGLLLYHAIADKNSEEVYQWVAFFLWLSANFVWMYGEVYNGDDDYVLSKAGIMMQVRRFLCIIKKVKLLSIYI